MTSRSIHLRWRGYCSIVSFSFGSQNKAHLLEPEGKLVILDVNGSNGGDFRLVVVYAPIVAGQPEFIRRLEVFLSTSLPFVLVGDFNAILVVKLDTVGLPDEKRNCKAPHTCSKYFKLSNRYRLDFPNMPMWTWIHRIGTSRSYLDRILWWFLDNDSISCPRLQTVGYGGPHRRMDFIAYLDLDGPPRLSIKDNNSAS